MTTGRYGLLAGVGEGGIPHLSGYVAESIVNWDETSGEVDYVVLNESGQVRDRTTGQWSNVDRYRECMMLDGGYAARVWSKTGQGFEPGPDEAAVLCQSEGSEPCVAVVDLVELNAALDKAREDERKAIE
jgi:hypothetical protein